jgi:hypothetical protein
MSGNFALIACGFDLREDHISGAIVSRDETRALLTHLSAVSAPDTGAAKALLVYARMATTACDWLDGDLCIDLVGEVDDTSIRAFTELGGGLRERLFAPMLFRAPLAEFARSIGRVPHMIAPLVMRSGTLQRVRLSAAEPVSRTTVPPPRIAISAESFFLRVPSPDGADDFADLPLPIVEPRPAPAHFEAPSVDERAEGSAPDSPPPKPKDPTDPLPLNDLDLGWEE